MPAIVHVDEGVKQRLPWIMRPSWRRTPSPCMADRHVCKGTVKQSSDDEVARGRSFDKAKEWSQAKGCMQVD